MMANSDLEKIICSMMVISFMSLPSQLTVSGPLTAHQQNTMILWYLLQSGLQFIYIVHVLTTSVIPES